MSQTEPSQLKVDHSFDIVIVGGGMAGSSMALMLADSGLKIAIVEKNGYQAPQQASFDDRCIALSWSSKKIFQKMGVWPELLDESQPEALDSSDHGATKTARILEKILHIHVSDQGKLGVTRLNHQQENVSALGYVVESRALGEVLTRRIGQHHNIQLFCPAELVTVAGESGNASAGEGTNESETSRAELNIVYQQQKICLSAGLIIAADGANSFAHARLEQAPSIKEYGQTAIIANVETEYPHQNIAYERFTPSGPLAMLPLTRNRCSLVWTVKEQQVDEILQMDENAFLSALQAQFGHRLGRITRTGQRVAYPLKLMQLDSQAVKKLTRLAFIGNAAHSVHPVAGQGFNLGLRDIAVLADLIKQTPRDSEGQWSAGSDLVEQYWQKRDPDIKRVGQITHGLIRIFSNNDFPWTPSRDIGLILADIIIPLKHRIARHAMGQGIIPIG